MESNKLEKRILDISYKKGLTHIGSCLHAVNIIYTIYEMMKPNDIFILSAAHSSLALYVVLEYNGKGDAEKLFDKHGVHCNRDLKDGIFASGGSLGHGIGIAVGVALADRNRDIYCLITDGESSEGSVFEAIRIAAEQKLHNLIILVCANGWSAYDFIDVDRLEWRIRSFIDGVYPKVSFIRLTIEEPDFLTGLKGHYEKLDKEKYDKALATLEKNGRISKVLDMPNGNIRS